MRIKIRRLELAACVAIIATLVICTSGCTSSNTTSSSSAYGSLAANDLAAAINSLYASKNYTVNTAFTMTTSGDTITYHGVVTDGPQVATPYERNVTVVLTPDRTEAFNVYQAAIDAQEAQGFQQFESSNTSGNIFWVGYLGTTYSSNPSTPQVRIDLNQPTTIGLILGGEYFEYLGSANVNNYYQVLTDQMTVGNGSVLGGASVTPAPAASTAGHNAVLETIVNLYNESVQNTGPLAWSETWQSNDNVSTTATWREGNGTSSMSDTFLAFPTTQDATNYLNAFYKANYTLIYTTSDWAAHFPNGDDYSRATGHNPQTFQEWVTLDVTHPHVIKQWDNILDFTAM